MIGEWRWTLTSGGDTKYDWLSYLIETHCFVPVGKVMKMDDGMWFLCGLVHGYSGDRHSGDWYFLLIFQSLCSQVLKSLQKKQTVHKNAILFASTTGSLGSIGLFDWPAFYEAPGPVPKNGCGSWHRTRENEENRLPGRLTSQDFGHQVLTQSHFSV